MPSYYFHSWLRLAFTQLHGAFHQAIKQLIAKASLDATEDDQVNIYIFKYILVYIPTATSHQLFCVQIV